MAAEKNFENKVKDFLTKHGSWFIKYWGGAKFTKEGIPDILACIDGKFVAIEVKAPNGKPTVVQLVTLRKIRTTGGFGLLLYPEDYEHFKNWLKKGSPMESDWLKRNIISQDKWFIRLTR